MTHARDEADLDETDVTVLRILRGGLQRRDPAFARTLRAADVPGRDSVRMAGSRPPLRASSRPCR